MAKATSACDRSAVIGSPDVLDGADREIGFQSTPGPPVKLGSAVPYGTGKCGCSRSSDDTSASSGGHDAGATGASDVASRTSPPSTVTDPARTAPFVIEVIA